MKAIQYHRFGSPEVLVIEEIPTPIPKDNEVLIEVYATTVNSGDSHLRRGEPFIARLFAGPIKPRNKILGTTLSGKIVSKGRDVKLFEVGDEVFASTGVKTGTHAQYVTISEDEAIVKKPESMGFEEAASLIFGSLTAKYFLNKAQISKGKKVLVIGASGSVGSAAVQLSKNYGASVTGVCSTQNIDFVKSIGADNVIDYKKEDIATHENKYDIILDTVASTSISKLKKILTESGIYITTAAKASVLLHMFLPQGRGKKVLFDLTKSQKLDLEYIKNLVTHGKYKPLIDRVYPMEDVQKAYEYIEKKSKQGNVVLKMK